MKLLKLKIKRETLKKFLFLFIILTNTYIIFNIALDATYENSPNIDDFFRIRISNSNATQFENIIYDNEVTWGNNITFSLNFTYTEDNGTTWDPVLDPNAYCNITIKEVGSTTVLISLNMTPLGDGIFFKMINSSRLSAGKYYLVIIEGYCPGYPSPNPYNILIEIETIPTGISMHNYTTLQELTINEVSQYYDELINVTFKYYNKNNNNSLIAETFTYWWEYGSGSVNIDPRNLDYYTLEINTSLSPHTGIYIFQVSATLENYTTQQYNFYLNILTKLATLNGETGLVYISSKLWVQEAHKFTFIYRDAKSNEILGDLNVADYIWQKLDETGNPVPGINGSGTLIENINKSYTLDFDTENRPIGNYAIILTLQKENYERRDAIIILEILLIPISVNGKSSNITISKEIEYQKAYNFTFEINNAVNLNRIGDLDQAFYYWYKIDSNGTVLEGPSENIDLIKDQNDLYILDFDTELRSIGFYKIYVEFHKENYSSRYAIINLTISPPLEINIISPDHNDVYDEIAPAYFVFIIGSYDSVWYTIDDGITNISISTLGGIINQDEWDKKENGVVFITFYANNSNGYVGIALVRVIKTVPEDSSSKVIGYDLLMLLGVVSIITIIVKKKIFESRLRKE